MSTTRRASYRMKHLPERTGMSPSLIYREIKDGNFPQGQFVAPNVRVWTEETIDAEMQRRFKLYSQVPGVNKALAEQILGVIKSRKAPDDGRYFNDEDSDVFSQFVIDLVKGDVDIREGLQEVYDKMSSDGLEILGGHFGRESA